MVTTLACSGTKGGCLIALGCRPVELMIIKVGSEGGGNQLFL